MANLFSALASMHAGVPDFCGYHFDIKPANILVRHDGSWALADLGMAHLKPVVPTDLAPTATSRRLCSEEYGAPDGDIVHRSFDVWSLGCVFAELLVWHAEGQKGVRRFRDSRRKKTGMKVTHEFHDDGKVKEAVLLKLESLSSNNSDPILSGSIRIVRLLLEPEQSKRPSSREAEILLRALLDNGVEKPSPVKPHVKELLEELDSVNKSKRRS
ncbi:kinase-like domain-containing protein [Trichophaea hybrida]|nr:kinase-like domain-containing protein [Trichophaea hybrida]